MRVEIRDAFGTIMAEGPLTVHDAPGVDEHTPSVAQQLATQLLGKRLPIQVPGMPDHMAYTVLVIE
jgi:hypothetical protein